MRLWREGVGRGGNTDVQNKEVAGILTPDRPIITTTTVSVHSGQETYYCENDDVTALHDSPDRMRDAEMELRVCMSE